MTKTFKTKGLTIVSLLLALAVVVGCGNASNKNKEEKVIAKEEIKAELDVITYPLPSPFELTKLINKIEATYILGIANDAADYKKYATTAKQAINLGVYSSDLAYSATYNKSDKSQAYLATLIELVKSLDLTGAIKKDMVERIEASLESKDESVEVITDLFYDTYSYMQKNNNTELSYLILAGTWVEGMYLVTNVSDNTMENLEILKIIMKQEESLKTILKLMDTFKSSDISKGVYVALNKVQSIYKLEAGSESLTKEQMLSISKEVAKVRASFIE